MCSPPLRVSPDLAYLQHFSNNHERRQPMAVKLEKSIKRELELDGRAYTIQIAPEGVKVTEKGKRKGREISWRSIISGDAQLAEDLKLSIDALGG
jgi:hypothetical protein